MEIEQGNFKEATASTGPAPQPVLPSEPVTQITTETDTTGLLADAIPAHKEEERLNTSNIAERAGKYSKKKAKTAETQSVEKELKTSENIEKDPVSTEITPETEQKDAKKFEFNPKYTAVSKEYELPKWAQAAIKDPETEKEIKDVFEKAMGLEHVKARSQEREGQFQELKTNFEGMYSGVQDLRDIYAEATKEGGNILLMEDFFKRLKIPNSVVAQYIHQRLQYEELDPQQRQAYDQHLNTQRRAKTLEQQNQGFQNSAVEAQSRAIGLELQSVLARPDIAPLVQNFENMPGRNQGAFWEAVKEEADYHWYKSQGKEVLPPEEAVKKVISRYGLSASPQAPQTQTLQNSLPPQSQAQQPSVQVSPHRDVPTIPTIAAKASASPMKTKPRSIDDLRKLQKERASM